MHVPFGRLLCMFLKKPDFKHQHYKPEVKVYTRKGTTTLTGSFLYTFPEESGLNIENIFRKELRLSLFISLFFFFTTAINACVF